MKIIVKSKTYHFTILSTFAFLFTLLLLGEFTSCNKFQTFVNDSIVGSIFNFSSSTSFSNFMKKKTIIPLHEIIKDKLELKVKYLNIFEFNIKINLIEKIESFVNSTNVLYNTSIKNISLINTTKFNENYLNNNIVEKKNNFLGNKTNYNKTYSIEVKQIIKNNADKVNNTNYNEEKKKIHHIKSHLTKLLKLNLMKLN